LQEGGQGKAVVERENEETKVEPVEAACEDAGQRVGKYLTARALAACNQVNTRE
jgi:hypothetical protein